MLAHALPPGSWAWPLCIPVGAAAGRRAPGAPGAAAASTRAPRASIHGLGGPGRLQLMLVTGKGDVIWDEPVSVDTAGTASFRLPRPHEPGVLWLLGFCPIDSRGLAAAIAAAGSPAAPPSPGRAAQPQPPAAATAAAAGEPPAATDTFVVEGVRWGSPPTPPHASGQLVLSVPMLAAAQPAAAEVTRLLLHLLKSRQHVEQEESARAERDLAAAQEQLQKAQQEHAALLEAAARGALAAAVPQSPAILAPITPGVTAASESSAPLRRQQITRTESEEVASDRLHAEWLQSRAQRYTGELQAPPALAHISSSGAISARSSVRSSARSSDAGIAAATAAAGAGVSRGSAAAAPAAAGSSSDSAPAALAASSPELGASPPRPAVRAPFAAAAGAAALARHAAGAASTSAPAPAAPALLMQRPVAPDLQLGSGQFEPGTVQAMIEHLWAPLASDIDLVLRGSSGAAVAPSTGPGAPAAAGAPVEGLTHLGVAIQLMQWLAECGYVECCAMLCDALQAQGVRLLCSGAPVNLGPAPLTGAALIRAAHAAAPPAPPSLDVPIAQHAAGAPTPSPREPAQSRMATGSGPLGAGVSAVPAGLAAFGLPAANWFGGAALPPASTPSAAAGATAPMALAGAVSSLLATAAGSSAPPRAQLARGSGGGSSSGGPRSAGDAGAGCVAGFGSVLHAAGAWLRHHIEPRLEHRRNAAGDSDG